MNKYWIVFFILIIEGLVYWQSYMHSSRIRPLRLIAKADAPEKYFSPKAINDLKDAYDCLPEKTKQYFHVEHGITNTSNAYTNIFFQSFSVFSVYPLNSFDKNGESITPIMYRFNKPVIIIITSRWNNDGQPEIVRIENVCDLFKMYN